MIYQHQKANGNFLVNPKLGDLKVADFSPDVNVDDWYLASMTIKGKIANWDVLYAGGWFSRTVLQPDRLFLLRGRLRQRPATPPT